jgi:hypothetical protein
VCCLTGHVLPVPENELAFVVKIKVTTFCHPVATHAATTCGSARGAAFHQGSNGGTGVSHALSKSVRATPAARERRYTMYLPKVNFYECLGRAAARYPATMP